MAVKFGQEDVGANEIYHIREKLVNQHAPWQVWAFSYKALFQAEVSPLTVALENRQANSKSQSIENRQPNLRTTSLL